MMKDHTISSRFSWLTWFAHCGTLVLAEGRVLLEKREAGKITACFLIHSQASPPGDKHFSEVQKAFPSIPDSPRT